MGEKVLITLATGVNVKKTFFSLITLRAEKLECLSAGSPFQLGLTFVNKAGIYSSSGSHADSGFYPYILE
jgi:hypothetical protein